MILELGAIDKDMDRGNFDDDTVFCRFKLKHKLFNVSEMESKDNFQKSKVKWAVEGDENSKFFHGIINKRRAHLANRGIFVDGFWETDPEVLEAFGFGRTWCNWIRGTLISAKASILINGSPSKDYSCHRGLKQGDPLAPYLFILIMESLHLSFNRVVDEGLFKGIQLPGLLSLSHLFYADDVMFIGEWSNENLSGIINILKSYFLASGLHMNILKSQLLGVCVPHQVVEHAASLIGSSIMSNKFCYLGVMVGEYSSRIKAWNDVIFKLRSRLSKWKVKTISIGGRLTLLKSVLGASPIYNMSIFKVPTGVLKVMETIRSRFFNGADQSEKKLHGSLGISLGFFRFGSPLMSKICWSECSSYLGGLSGTLGIGSFFKNLLQDVRRFLML
nr:RNA-directed DNA polymerase, eukaryota [Tanacetum cinerariifolium]